MKPQFNYCGQCGEVIGYTDDSICSSCKEDAYEQNANDFNRARLIVGSKMLIKDNGFIVCSEEKWETLSPFQKGAVYYLCNEFDYTVIDE